MAERRNRDSEARMDEQGSDSARSVMERIEALPGAKAFRLTIEMAPDRWSEDNAL